MLGQSQKYSRMTAKRHGFQVSEQYYNCWNRPMQLKTTTHNLLFNDDDLQAVSDTMERRKGRAEQSRK